MTAIRRTISEKFARNFIRRYRLEVYNCPSHIGETDTENATQRSATAHREEESRGQNYSHAAKFLTELLCTVVLLAHSPAADAATASATLNITTRVTRGCRVLTSPGDFIPSDPRALQVITSVDIRPALTINCATPPHRTGTMAISTKTSKAAMPIIKVYSERTGEEQGNQPDRTIARKTHPYSKIIHWGLFPIDTSLVISIPDQDRTGEPILSDRDGETLKLFIDF